MKRNIYLLLLVLSTTIISCTTVQMPGVSPYSNEKNLLELSFLKVNNPSLDKDYAATIGGKDVNIELPKGTNLKKLIPTFKLSDKATLKIGTTVIVSGKTEVDFSNLTEFKVVAQNETVNTYYSNLLLIGLLPNQNINLTTSYNTYLKNDLYIDLSTAIPNTSLNQVYTVDSYQARAYADFDKDGDIDIIAVAQNKKSNNGLEVEFYKNNTFQFVKDQSVFTGGAPKMIGGRKAIVADLDGNGWPDVVIAGIGYDSSPYAGEGIKVLMNFNGKFTSKDIGLGVGYFASVTAGDIDNDGDIDLFVTDNKTISKFLINDGLGNFKIDNSLYPNTFYNKGYFTSELYDINGDGYLDLVIAGHEHTGNNTIVLWGNASGNYLTSKMTTIPKVIDFGVVVDIDFIDYDKDGKMDMLITRTGDGASETSNYYRGYYLQLLKGNATTFTDVTSTALKNNISYTENWINWIRIKDVDNDGDLDITTDDKLYNLVWINNNGVFSKP